MGNLGRVTVDRKDGLYQVLIGPLASEFEQKAVLARAFSEGATNAREVER